MTVQQPPAELDARVQRLLGGVELAPLRLRLRGNLLYLGADSTDEKFFGLINRSDRRRWISGTSTLMLDEALGTGTWARLDLDSTKISPLRCEPVVRKSP